MHIIRNAIDHGIETAGRRAHARASRGAARSRSRPRQKGNHVVIEVSDDGAGIDEERIREVAVQQGLITAQQAAETDAPRAAQPHLPARASPPRERSPSSRAAASAWTW